MESLLFWDILFFHTIMGYRLCWRAFLD